ncbi:LacI family DNA-binding transcriptional regulator [Nakamurella endophytica]|uniref:LacI family transcriptional regulator n=1 Tax=Nakamurella endophytica TaxID=1748367 RepID=A0A917SY03_9ACTN|nr:LacI family DNA-binding transcriptional regulator [Nakamurella endophytica]GGM01817.1 LacI family transcriptional regulator [Nakamurella endophytica]
MPTISDVARVAGVSTATVSRVLNGNTEVDAAMAARVRTAVDQLAYRPSRIARSLRTRRSAVLGLVISDIRNPFFTDMVRGVEDVAFANGYSVVLCNSDENLGKERDYLQLAIAESMAGVILAPASLDETDVSALTGPGIPVVTVDRRAPDPAVDRVLIDNARGARLAVGHLVDQGYRRIACVSGPTTISTGAERLAGYRAVVRSRRLRTGAELIRFADFHEASGRSAMSELLAARQDIDAVFVANNLMTLGALQAVADAGLVIPDDIAVVGFDDMSWAPLLRPPLTTVAQPTYDLGAETARLLLDRINGFTGPGRELVLPPTLRVRASSAPRRER